MIDRYGVEAVGYWEHYLDDEGDYVLYEDHLAAVAEAEQRGREPSSFMHFMDGYEKGQRDMLARCIAAVEAIGVDGDPRPVMTVMQGHYIKRDDALSALEALRALGGSDE